MSGKTPAHYQSTTELRQMIEALIARWGKAIREKNLEELLDMIAEDAVFVGSTAPPLVGREAIGAHYSAYFEKFNVEIVADPSPEMVLMGDTVVLWTDDRTILTPADKTAPIALASRNTTLLSEEKGSWKITRGLSCVVAADAEPK